MGAKTVERMKQIKGVVYLGTVSHDRAIALMQGSDMVLQPSKIEGIPRVSLEALSLGKKVLLPPCVPEFVIACPNFCPVDVKPESICTGIEKVLTIGKPPSYNLKAHDPEAMTKKVNSVYKHILKT